MQADRNAPVPIVYRRRHLISLRLAVAAKEMAAHKEGFKGKVSSFYADMRVLASHPIYVLTVAGTAIYVGAGAWYSMPLARLGVHPGVGRLPQRE